MVNVNLGPLKLSSDLILAPMMDVTTPSYILMIQHYGGLGFYSIPMVFVNQISQAPKTVKPVLEFAEKNIPSSVQICGSGKSYETIKMALDVLNSYDFSIVDVNAGCPARHTCNSGGGASLMKPHRFQDLQYLVHSIAKHSNKPVSVKIRTGWDSKDGLEGIVKMIEDEGASFLTIHGRLAKDGYSGTVDLDSIKKVKELSNIPIVGNGDIFNHTTYHLMKEITKVDAVMIGRAVMGFPATFAEIDAGEKSQKTSIVNHTSPLSHFYSELLVDREPNTPSKIQEYLQVLLNSIESLGSYYNNDKFKLIELRKNAIWMMKGMHNCAKTREKLGKIKNIRELLHYVHNSHFVKDLSPKTNMA
ncbi:MAG: tRNA-dihydrouridine synthase family protein [Candidatus Lokiarchaeota archaeon]|nr:tRNA-dihydrouridine synthase family protein [Candidatus Lokiarchaeota archaeon]